MFVPMKEMLEHASERGYAVMACNWWKLRLKSIHL